MFFPLLTQLFSKRNRRDLAKALVLSLIFILTLSLTYFENSQAGTEDLVPPRSPQYFSVKSLNQSLQVDFKQPATDDVFSNIVYWRADGENEYQQIFLGQRESQLIENLINGKTYYLSVASKDKAGNESARTHEIAIAPSENQSKGSFQVSAWVPPAGWSDNAGYYTFDSHAEMFNFIRPFWYNAEADGSLSKKGNAPEENLMNAAKRSGVKVLPTITNNFDDGDKLSKLLGDRALVEHHLNVIVNEVVGQGYDGIDIDYENLEVAVKSQYTDFLSQLKSRLQEKGKLLSITVQAKKSDSDSWRGAGATDYQALGKIADQFVVMTYDYHRTNTSPGAVAPIDWVQEVLEYAKSKVDSAKIFAGVPFYGYDWCVSSSNSTCENKALLWEGVQNIIGQYNPPVEWDDRTKTPWFYYQQRTGEEHVVYFENHESLQAKLDLFHEMNIAGFSVWQLGGEDPESISAIRARTGKDKIVTPGVRVTPGDRSIDVSWDLLARNEINGYRLYFKKLDGEEIRIDVDEKTSSYHLAGVENDAVYSVFLAALTGAGEEFSKTAQMLVNPQDLFYPGKVEDIKVQQVGETTIDIAFVPSGDEYFFGQAAGVDLRFSKQPIDANNFEAAEKYSLTPEPLPAGNRQKWQLRDLEPGQKYYIALKIIDEAGNKSDISTVVEATTFDTVPPATPQGVEVSSSSATVRVSWQANSEQDLAGYKVYYRQEEGYYNIAETPKETIMIDLGNLENEQKYFVSLTAVDVRGNESERTAELATTPTAGSLLNRIADYLSRPVDKVKASLMSAGEKLALAAAVPYLVVVAVFVINLFVYRGLKLEIQRSRTKKEEEYLDDFTSKKNKRLMKF